MLGPGPAGTAGSPFVGPTTSCPVAQGKYFVRPPDDTTILKRLKLRQSSLGSGQPMMDTTPPFWLWHPHPLLLSPVSVGLGGIGGSGSGSQGGTGLCEPWDNEVPWEIKLVEKSSAAARSHVACGDFDMRFDSGRWSAEEGRTSSWAGPTGSFVGVSSFEVLTAVQSTAAAFEGGNA